MGLNFFDTVAGHKLTEHTIPEIAKQLERIANSLEKINQIKEQEIKDRISRDMTDCGPM
jgi:Asp-tRNA(Asn)/Glu-tRNA(Gln) amidotransferase C subunit